MLVFQINLVDEMLLYMLVIWYIEKTFNYILSQLNIPFIVVFTEKYYLYLYLNLLSLILHK